MGGKGKYLAASSAAASSANPPHIAHNTNARRCFILAHRSVVSWLCQQTRRARALRALIPRINRANAIKTKVPAAKK